MSEQVRSSSPNPVDTASETTPVHLRDALAEMPPYVPGKPAPVIEGLTAYKISANENPYPPLPSVLDAVREAAGSMNRYPETSSAVLRDELAARCEVPASRIAVGPGSVGALAQIMQATCDEGDEVIFAWRSFEAYPIMVSLVGAKSVMVPLTPELRHDLDAMAAAVTDRTRVIIVCSPNNPTGPLLRSAELDAFLEKVPERVLVVIDEAYIEFNTVDDVPDALAVHRARPNVAVLRTFSKAYGLAGMRIGYAVAHEPIADALRKTHIPFSVSLVAQTAAIASLHAQDELDVRVKDLVGERERILAALKDQGWELPEAGGNFIYFPIGELTPLLAKAAEDQALMLRPYGTDGVRATIGEREANDRLIEICAAFRREHFA